MSKTQFTVYLDEKLVLDYVVEDLPPQVVGQYLEFVAEVEEDGVLIKANLRRIIHDVSTTPAEEGHGLCRVTCWVVS